MTMSGERKWSSVGLVGGLFVAMVVASSCTLYHSKIPIADSEDSEVSPDSVFVTEDDSGLALLGIFVVSEPDHYSVLVERARRRYKCERLHHVQLDFYSDYWLFVGFPIARITAICEPMATKSKSVPEEEEVPEAPAAPEPPAPPAPPTPPDPPALDTPTAPDTLPSPHAPDATGPG